MFAALLFHSVALAAVVSVTMFTLEVMGMPVISDWEREVQRGLRQGHN